MSRVAIYARFSTDRQSATSAEDQVRICTERCEREGWQVVQIYTDLAISGANIRRPGMTQMLADAAAGSFDIVMAEALDRIARDQEDIAGIHKRVTFAGARLFTLTEGQIDELQIGFKGTMGALFLKDLADKIRRGQRGALTRGRIPGGLCYGYDAAPVLRPDGTVDRGIRVINEAQAEVVRRIYTEYAAGLSPRAICRNLNLEGFSGARGGEWRPSALVGSHGRLLGVLQNPIYNGRFVYNRVHMVRDPETRNRLSRNNPEGERVEQAFPELKIVGDDLWNEVQAARAARAMQPLPRRRRPRHFLSGLAVCGECQGIYSVHTKNRWACGRHKAAGTCSNGNRVSTEELSSRVLAGLQEQLLAPEAIQMLVREYHAQRERNETRRAAEQAQARSRIAKIDAAVERLVAAIADGADLPEIRTAIVARREERKQLLANLEEQDASNIIALHPAIADAYRKRIKELAQSLATDRRDGAVAAQVRDLIERVIITPRQTGGVDIEVFGSLGAVIDLARGSPRRGRVPPTVLLVAEEGLEPPTPGL